MNHIGSSNCQQLNWGTPLAYGAGLSLLVLLSTAIGTHDIAPAVVWQALVHFDPTQSDHLLIRYLRLPRALLAILIGAGLAAAGVIMQALTRNPLADPGILGVNAGASVAVASGIAMLGITTPLGLLIFGMAGAAVTGLLILLLSSLRLGGDPIRVVLAGTAISAVLLALTHIITLNSQEQVFDQFRHWAVGALQGRGHSVLLPLAIPMLIGLTLTLLLSHSLDTLVLGRELGRALGVHVQRTWLTAGLVVILLTGGATAAAGPIAFIGLTAPHLARFLVGASHRRLLPRAMLIGAVLMLAADTLGRRIAHPGEVSVGIMIALIGGPFLVGLARRRSLAQL
ncbi:FecCD family ABC transporter permease [Vreelandella olivaria]|uniref:FecCD family ABC transporter permease n=1 Tax=Vreelandella olivaria TaxID=390919 RepID=UPI00201F3F5F|nr:iron ABC transporter permease [Halomonas olivaria]